MSPLRGRNQWGAVKVGRVLLLLAVAFFLVGVGSDLQAPSTYWGQANVDWASSGGAAPTRTSLFYLLLLRILGAAGLAGVSSLRLFQAAGVLLTAPLIYLLARRLWGGDAPASVAVALYLLSPATIRGTQSLDLADASYLPAVFCAWVLWYLVAGDRRWRDSIVLVLLSATAFTVKSTSSLGLLLIPTCGIVLARSREDRRDQLLKGVAGLLGLLIFLLAWAVVPIDLGIGATVGGVWEGLGSVVSRDPASTAFQLALGLAWWGPWMAVLTLWGARTLWRDAEHEGRAVVCGVLVYCVVYLVIGGMNHGYPRYYVAVLPVFAVLAVGPLRSRLPDPGDPSATQQTRAFRPPQQSTGEKSRLAAVVVAAVLLVFVGDPILGLNVGVRRAVLEGGLGARLAGEAFRWTFWVGIPIVVAWPVSSRWPRRVLVATIASFVALGIVQARGDYMTAYEYGTSGREEVVERVEDRVPAGVAVVAPPSLSARLAHAGLSGMNHLEWRSRETVLDYIDWAEPQALVVGITENSLEQVRWLLSDPPAVFAHCPGRSERIGTYWLCFVRDHDG